MYHYRLVFTRLVFPRSTKAGGVTIRLAFRRPSARLCYNFGHHWSGLMRTLLACFLAAAAAARGQIGPEVIGAGNFIHKVASLDKSLEFYHDVLGMELQR